MCNAPVFNVLLDMITKDELEVELPSITRKKFKRKYIKKKYKAKKPQKNSVFPSLIKPFEEISEEENHDFGEGDEEE